jgi:hypothetical protein
MASSKHEIAWDIPQQLSSWLPQNTKSLGTSRKSCRHGVPKTRNRLGHPATVVVMVSSNHEIAWDIPQKLSSWCPQNMKSLGTSRKSCRHGFFKRRNRLGHPAKVVVMASSKHEIAWDVPQKLSSWLPQNTKSLGTSRKSCLHGVLKTRNRLGHPAKVVFMVASKHEIAWDIQQKLSSRRPQTTKSLGTSRKSCHHGFLKPRNRLGHPAKVEHKQKQKNKNECENTVITRGGTRKQGKNNRKKHEIA